MKIFRVENRKPDQMNVVAKDVRDARDVAMSFKFAKKAENLTVTHMTPKDFHGGLDRLGELLTYNFRGRLMAVWDCGAVQWLIVNRNNARLTSEWSVEET